MIKRLIMATSIAFMLSAMVTLCVVWIVAFHNGGQTVVTINEYGEQTAEFFLWIVGIAVTAVGLTLMVEATE